MNNICNLLKIIKFNHYNCIFLRVNTLNLCIYIFTFSMRSCSVHLFMVDCAHVFVIVCICVLAQAVRLELLRQDDYSDDQR